MLLQLDQGTLDDDVHDDFKKAAETIVSGCHNV